MASLLEALLRILQQVLCTSSSPQTEQQQDGEVSRKDEQPSNQLPPKRQGKTPPHDREHKPHRPYHNENLINQNDLHYKELRARANEEGDAMRRCFEESHRAYEANERARAKQLSEEGHAHQREMNNLNAQASEWIFQANNTDSQPGEVDLHGLYVKEAITYTERAIQEAQSRGDSEIRLIVGKGLHSPEHVAKLKPAIEELVQKYNFSAHIDENNGGVLVVALDGGRREDALNVDDITRRLEDKNKDCVIM